MTTSVEDVKSRLNIVDFIGEYVRLQKSGAHFKGLCPFHNEKTPSFMVNEEKQIWHCFGCNKGGDIISFLMEIESLNFLEALKLLADRAGIALQVTGYGQQEDKGEKKNKIYEILELATKWYEKQLWEGEGKKEALPYLLNRGIHEQTLKLFRIGYAPKGWNHIETFLARRGYVQDEIEESGLLVRKEGDVVRGSRSTKVYDRFRDRIMFPITDVLGRVIGYSARVLPGQDEKSAKYINTPETSVYHKSQIVYGISLAKQEIKKKDSVIVVEGNMDVLAMHQAGFFNTIAVSGTALTTEHIKIFKRYTKNAVLFFDMDTAGQEAARKSVLLGFQDDMNLSMVGISGGKDAAELAKENLSALQEAIDASKPAMEYFLNVLFGQHDSDTAIGKKIIAQDAAILISAMCNEVEKSFWIQRSAELLGVGSDAFLSVLRDVEGRHMGASSRAYPEDISAREYAVENRQDILRRQLAGLLLASPRTWSDLAGKMQSPDEALFVRFLKQDALLQKILEDGEMYDFNFEKFLSSVHNSERESLAESLYHHSKFEVDEKGNLLEIDEGECFHRSQRCLEELRKEMKRETKKKIESDIKKAEQRGDKQAVASLMREFSIVLRELN